MTATSAPVAPLLPALDSTAMGWKHRYWYSPADTKGFYDVAGNIGPTIWWDGAIVGMWASMPTGVELISSCRVARILPMLLTLPLLGLRRNSMEPWGHLRFGLRWKGLCRREAVCH